MKKKKVTIRLNALEKARHSLYLSLEVMLDAASVHDEPTNDERKRERGGEKPAGLWRGGYCGDIVMDS